MSIKITGERVHVDRLNTTKEGSKKMKIDAHFSQSDFKSKMKSEIKKNGLSPVFILFEKDSFEIVEKEGVKYDVIKFFIRFDGVNSDFNCEEYRDKPFLVWNFLPTFVESATIGNAKERSMKKREDKIAIIEKRQESVSQNQEAVYMTHTLKVLVLPQATKYVMLELSEKIPSGKTLQWIESIFYLNSSVKNYESFSVKQKQRSRRAIRVYLAVCHNKACGQIFHNALDRVTPSLDDIGPVVHYLNSAQVALVKQGSVLGEILDNK